MAQKLDEIVDIHGVGSQDDILTWLPTYVLDEDVSKTCLDSREDDHHLFSKRRSVLNDGIETCGEEDHHFYSKQRSYNKHRHQPPYGRKSSAVAQPPLLPSPPNWKSYSKPDQKPGKNWAAGGPGMQAVFLDSRQRTCGTGVFLPRTAGTEVEKPRKPAFAPVLLPSRVVQALNLNVHGLGLQIKPREQNNNVKESECNQIRNKKSRDVPSQICVITQNRSSSPEIFLPKEWTY
uniref:uncharacterized protein LOC122583950 n=1 Tax=Erigeron canadensis TaxID=72917 RepID=UPI001CB8EE30|nr:uncharacterized protein LOC122583950 [Erigeron canadensis]